MTLILTMTIAKSLSEQGHLEKSLFRRWKIPVKAEPSAFDEHANDLALNDKVDRDNWESNNSLPIEKKIWGTNNKNLPLHGTKNPDIEEIFRICLLEHIPAEKCVKEKPLRKILSRNMTKSGFTKQNKRKKLSLSCLRFMPPRTGMGW